MRYWIVQMALCSRTIPAPNKMRNGDTPQRFPAFYTYYYYFRPLCRFFIFIFISFYLFFSFLFVLVFMDFPASYDDDAAGATATAVATNAFQNRTEPNRQHARAITAKTSVFIRGICSPTGFAESRDLTPTTTRQLCTAKYVLLLYFYKLDGFSFEN